MKIDKRRAVAGRWRIREATLWKIAIAGGAFGAFIGMRRYRHKTKHRSFVFGMPLLMLIWGVFIVNLIVQRIVYLK